MLLIAENPLGSKKPNIKRRQNEICGVIHTMISYIGLGDIFGSKKSLAYNQIMAKICKNR